MALTKIENWFKDRNINSDVLLFYAFVCALFALPFGTAPQNIFGALAACVWFFSGKGKRIKMFYKSSWFFPVIAFILIPWIGLLYTADQTGLGLDYAKKSYYWIYCMAAASISFHAFPTQRLMYAFLSGLAINVFIAALQIVGVVHTMRDGRFHGVGDVYSTLSAFLIIGILSASYFFKNTKEKKTKFFFLFLILLYFFHIVILRGRNGYVTLLILSPIIATNFFRRINAVKIILFCALVAGLMYLSPVVKKRIDFSIYQVKAILNADPETAYGKKHSPKEERTYITRGAVEAFMENPIFGVGTGGFRAFTEKRGKAIDHPHNNILYMAVSFGLVGVAVLFWLFVEIIKNAWKNRETPLGYFLLSTSLVIFVSGVFNSQILDTGTLFLFAVTTGFQQGFPKFQDRALPA